VSGLLYALCAVMALGSITRPAGKVLSGGLRLPASNLRSLSPAHAAPASSAAQKGEGYASKRAGLGVQRREAPAVPGGVAA
jgi:hypothetical protein